MSKQFYFKKFNLVYKTVPFQTNQFQTIQFSISTQFRCKSVLFQIIQCNINTQFISIWTIDWAISGATTPGQSVPESDENEGVFRIPKCSIITWTLRWLSRSLVDQRINEGIIWITQLLIISLALWSKTVTHFSSFHLFFLIYHKKGIDLSYLKLLSRILKRNI